MFRPNCPKPSQVGEGCCVPREARPARTPGRTQLCNVSAGRSEPAQVGRARRPPARGPHEARSAPRRPMETRVAHGHGHSVRRRAGNAVPLAGRWRRTNADSRQQTADSRQRTADSGQRTADSGQQTADSVQRRLVRQSARGDRAWGHAGAFPRHAQLDVPALLEEPHLDRMASRAERDLTDPLRARRAARRCRRRGRRRYAGRCRRPSAW